MQVDSERRRHAAAIGTLTEGERIQTAWKGVMDLEGIILEIRAFALTLGLCDDTTEEPMSAALSLITDHLKRLSSEAEDTRGVIFHALHSLAHGKRS